MSSSRHVAVTLGCNIVIVDDTVQDATDDAREFQRQNFDVEEELIVINECPRTGEAETANNGGTSTHAVPRHGIPVHIHNSLLGREARYWDESVCPSVCPRSYLKNHDKKSKVIWEGPRRHSHGREWTRPLRVLRG